MRTVHVKHFCTPGDMYDGTRLLHDVYMVAKKQVRPRFKRRELRRTFIREWRNHRGLSLEALAERIGITHASLSRIETRKQPYSQPILEALAAELQTDPASLLMRDPSDPEGMWSIWDQAKHGEKRAIVEHAKIILKTGT